MDFRSKLAEHIGINDIKEIILQIDNSKKQELYNLLADKDEKVGYHAAWVLTHLSVKENSWLYICQDELITNLLDCNHTGKRRLILSIIYKKKLGIEPISIKLLNYCLERMTSQIEPSGIRSLCVKVAYSLCYNIPELLQEFSLILQSMEDEISSAILSIVRNTQKKINRKK